MSILGPGIGTDLFGDVPSPLFYEIVKEKDGRHFANKKVSDLGPNNLGFQSSILGSIIFEPEPNRLLSGRDARGPRCGGKGRSFFGLLRVKVKFGKKGLDS